MASANASSGVSEEPPMPGAFPEGNDSPVSTTTHQTLAQALFERRAEYSRPRHVRIKVGTWNVAGFKGTEKDIGAWFVQGKGIDESMAGLGVSEHAPPDAQPRESIAAQEARSSTLTSTVPHHDHAAVPGGEEVGIYALGLQEVVDIGSATEALRPYTDPTVANRWKSEIENVLPAGYKLVAEQQLIGLLLLIYAAADVQPHIKSVSTTSVGTGLMGYMGNKGAVTARIVLGETTRLVFVNCHLAAGNDKAALERRNWDAAQIGSRTRFDPIADSMGLSQASGEGIGEEDFAFWFGDLNYRLEGIPGDDVRRLLTIHTKGLDPETTDDPSRHSISSESSSATKTSLSTTSTSEDAIHPEELDPASLQTTLSSLLPHDELHQQQKTGKAFHDGWKEGPIRFLPSYKYDVGKVGVFDSSEKKRGPSWCDRILYRTRAAKLRYELRKQDQEAAKKRDEELKARGVGEVGVDEDVLYDYDPETDGVQNSSAVDYDEYDDNTTATNPEPEAVQTRDGFEDEITLEYYTSHMRVLSSDHKPLSAIFALKFDAVIPDLKAAIHQEVARELDRQENEGRPSITVAVDRSTSSDSSRVENRNTTYTAFEGVDFNDIHYAKTKKRNITIANTGRVPASFGFVDRPVPVGSDEPQGPFPSWLTVSCDKEPDPPAKRSPELREQYTLLPAEVLNIELKLSINTLSAVRNLNEGTTLLDETLILRVLGGRDHFLPIRGRWLQSSLARSIDKLVKIPEGGIRKLQHQMPSAVEDDKVRWSVPREIFRLTEALEGLVERSIAEWGMLGQQGARAPWQDNAGWPFVKDTRWCENGKYEVLADVFEALDTDSPFEEAFEADTTPLQRVEIVAQALLVFLRGLVDGVVTGSLWRELEEEIIKRERSKQQLLPDDERMLVIETLSKAPHHNATFLLLMSMIQHVAREVAGAIIAENTTSHVSTSQTSPSRTSTSTKRMSTASTTSTSTVKGTENITPRTSTDILPSSPQVSIRRKTLSKIPKVAVRQLVNRNYATVFADAIFRTEEGAGKGGKEKDKDKRRERTVRVVEIFVGEEGV